jgi:hypothetical protein
MQNDFLATGGYYDEKEKRARARQGKLSATDVDRDDRPILIDQPEENLDNQTIVGLLVSSVKEAKRRRQIIIVTH